MEDTTSSGKPIVHREKTSPFLIRTFVKIGNYHRLAQFEDGPLPLSDEQQVYTCTVTHSPASPSAPSSPTPLRAAGTQDLGTVYSRDILGEPGSLDSPAPRLLDNTETQAATGAEQDRTLDELRFVPGDYLCVMVTLPKGATVPSGPGGELTIKGSAVGGPANGWKGAGAPAGGRGDGGWGGSVAVNPGPGSGRGAGGHWRGNSSLDHPAPRGGRGRGGNIGRDRERERDRDRDRERDRDDRRVPPPRRDSPPRRGDGG
ncbi:hypothetical protein LXA43DRAFT_1103913 [Ganoderma leucocontextum]|nr:hypothetical protein LXA43DRAFT_1103913 [Ganoderma leucocontextum]